MIVSTARVMRWVGPSRTVVAGVLAAAVMVTGFGVPVPAQAAEMSETPAMSSAAAWAQSKAQVATTTPAPTPTTSADAPAATSVEVATGEIAPGQESVVVSPEITVTFSGAQITDTLDVTVDRLATGAAEDAALAMDGVAIGSVFDVDAATADGTDVTVFPGTVTAPDAAGSDRATEASGGTGSQVLGGPVSSSTLLSRSATPAASTDWPAPGVGIDDAPIGTTPAADGSGWDTIPATVTPLVEEAITPGVVVEITLPADDLAGVDTGSVRVATREDASAAWTLLPSYLDAGRGVVVAHVDHLSQFVVIGDRDVAATGPRIVLDPDNDIAHTSGPGGPATELAYNVALANQVAAKLTQQCLADVVVTRTDTSAPMVDQSVRAGMALAHDPVLTTTLAFDAALGSPWGNIGNGGSKIYSRGGPADVGLAGATLDTLPLYTGRPATPTERANLPYDEFAGVPGALMHLETLYIDHNFDRPVIDAGFESIADGVFVSMGRYLETQGYDCTNPDRGGGWPAPPTSAQMSGWMQLGFKNYAAYGGDPVNFATGNLVTLLDLFTTSGPGGQSSQTALVHNGQDDRVSRFGRGWTSTWSARAQRFDDGSVMVVRGDGASYTFAPDGVGGFAADANNGARLHDVGGGRLELAIDDGDTWVFDTSHPEGVGDLVEIRESGGAVTTLTYAPLTGDPLFRALTQVTLPGNQVITVATNAQGLVTGLSTPDGRTWTLAYDGAWNLTTVTGPDGRTRSFGYDGAGKILTGVDEAGVTYQVNTYDAQGRVSAQSDAQGNVRTLAYAPGSTAYTDAEGSVWTYTVDGRSRITSSTDPLGATTTFAFGALDAVTAVTDPDGATTALALDAAGRPLEVTGPDGAVTVMTYDPVGRLVQVRQPAPGGAVTTTVERDSAGHVVATQVGTQAKSTFAYDPSGNLTVATDPAGAVTTFTWDSRGNLLTETDPLGRITTHTYDLGNRLTSTLTPAGAQTTFAYDTAGRLITQTAPDGGVTSYGYNALDLTTTVTDPLGGVTTMEWDSLAHLVAVTDAEGATEHRTYNREDALTSQTDPIGAVTAYTLDAAHRAVGVTDPLGGRWSTTLDPVGRALELSDPAGGVTTYTYDDAGRVLTAVDADGVSTERSYDGAGNITGVTDGQGNVTVLVYDELSQLISSTDAAGATTLFTWDAAGQLTGATDAAGNATAYTYDAAGQLLETLDPSGAATTYSYNADGYVVAATDADTVRTDLVVDWAGRTTSEVDARGAAWTTSYDLVGRVVTETNPLGQVTAVTYDGVSNPVTATNALGETTTYTWDGAGRQVGTVAPSGTATSYGYDPAGQLVEVIANAASGADPASDTNVVTTYSYSPTGDLIETLDPLGQVTTAAFTPGGRLASATNPLGAVESYTYNDAGQLAGTVDPDGRTTAVKYTSTGQLSRRTFTAAGLPERVEDFAYDAVGNLISTIDPTGETGWTYDTVGQVTGERTGAGTITTQYTAAGRIAAKTLADGTTSTYAYDEAGYPTSTTTALGVESYVLDPAAQLESITRATTGAADVVTTFERDGLGRPTAITHTTAPDSPFAAAQPSASLTGDTAPSCLPAADYLAGRTLPGTGSATGIDTIALTYAYTPGGQVATSTRTDTGSAGTISSQALTATYDGLGRLIGTSSAVGQLTPTRATARSAGPVALPGAQGCALIAGIGYTSPGLETTTTTTTSEESYTWDAAGNRVATTAVAGGVTTSTAATFNGAHQITAATTTTGQTPVAETAYTYDQSGNRTTETSHDLTAPGALPVTTTTSYDSAGAPLSIDAPEMDVTYSRDALGRQVSEHLVTALSDREITQTWDGLTLSGRTDPDHGTTAYTYDPMGTITTQTGTATAGGGSWLLGDALGSTLAQVSAGGAITESTSWDPWGQQAFHTTGWDTRVGYTGEQTDAGLGLVSFYARSYDPTTATFTTPDAWGGLLREPQTLHRYAYVLGDPLTTTDVLGYWPSWAEKAGNWVKDTASTATNHLKDNWRTYASVAASVVVGAVVVAGAAACIAATAGLCAGVVAGAAMTVGTGMAAGGAGAAAGYALTGDDGKGSLSWAGLGVSTALGAAGGGVLGKLGGVGAGVTRGLTNLANRITASHSPAVSGTLTSIASRGIRRAPQALAAWARGGSQGARPRQYIRTQVGGESVRLPAAPQGVGGIPVKNGTGVRVPIQQPASPLHSSVAGVRFMPAKPNQIYPIVRPYAAYYNKAGQTISPLTGKTVKASNPWGHLQYGPKKWGMW